MFRKMRRFKQQLSEEECISILENEPRGVLSVLGDDGYPYGMPLSFKYKDGKIYFHGAGEGHRFDSIQKCDKVSFCVYDQGYRNEGEWALNIKSVIVFGHISVIEDREEKKEALRGIGYKFTSDEEYIEHEVSEFLERAACLRIDIEHMTGKLVNES